MRKASTRMPEQGTQRRPLLRTSSPLNPYINPELTFRLVQQTGALQIHEHLPPQVRKELKETGWTKGRELAKLARAEGQRFVCAPWVHKARSMPREEFKREVEKELTGRETEPHEIIYFRLYKSQIPVIEQAIETAGLMLGTDKSRGYCLEMICADSLAGANLENGDPEILWQSTLRFFKFLPGEQKRTFLEHVANDAP
jgi:hypothetical protein